MAFMTSRIKFTILRHINNATTFFFLGSKKQDIKQKKKNTLGIPELLQSETAYVNLLNFTCGIWYTKAIRYYKHGNWQFSEKSVYNASRATKTAPTRLFF